MKDTAHTIAAVQHPDGAIPWEAGRHVDPWNHTEAAMGMAVTGLLDESRAAYHWLATTQNPDGSWYTSYEDGHAADTARDTNYTAYIAVGVRHHWLLTQDDDFLTTMWPAVRKAIDFVTRQQRTDGTIPWRPNEDIALLSGCASIHHALHSALHLAEHIEDPQPSWQSAAHRLAAAIQRPEDHFLPKPHSMDWYYPALCGVTEISALQNRWNDFVVPGLGVKCVQDQPWVTGGETAELALTLAARGDVHRAHALLTSLTRLRHTDGSYWTGYQYANDVLWPDERTTWTAGAVLLAHAAVRGEPATVASFNPTPVARRGSRSSPVAPAASSAGRSR